MELLYHTIIGILILAVSPYILLRMAVDPAFRAEVSHRLKSWADLPSLRSCIWIHAASVGEVQAAKILIRSLKEQCRPVILSTFTRTGYDLAKSFAPVFRLPPDLPFWLEPLFDKIDPSILILIEGELWPSLLCACKRREVPVLLANGRISEKSFNRYGKVKSLFRWATAPIKLFSMRTAADADRLKKLGIPESLIRITGNMKFDALESDENQGRESNTPLVVFGSTRPGDEVPILEAIVRLREEVPGTRFVIAPRHLNRIPEIISMIQDHKLEFELHSRLGEKSQFSGLSGTPAGERAGADDNSLDRFQPPAGAEKVQPFDLSGRLILLDRMGELNHYYARSCVAFVGGGFNPEHGGQNILEPAAFYQPVIFGGHMDNFAEEAR
ncbi:MAG: hypothetical protein A3K09_02090, partial [Nitrospinae bacterium RIFCSPLOWO2_12_FULL_47_7]